MSLSVSVRKRQGDFSLDATFETTSNVTALFGPSGSGKTTLVNIVAGLAKPDTGFVRVDGTTLVDTSEKTSVATHRRRIGYVFQEGRLFPHLSVRSNLLYGARSAPLPLRWAKLDMIVSLLGIDHLLRRRPAFLSGGEKQRVAIGRALMTSPQLLLMDEPLAAIDQTRRSEILPYLDRLRSEMNIPIVYVSHSIDEIARIADEVVLMENGHSVTSGPTADILARLDIEAFAGNDAGTILTATVRSVDRDRGTTLVEHSSGTLKVQTSRLSPGDAIRIRVHARDVAIAIGDPGNISIRNRLPATIAEMRSAAGNVDLRLDVAGSPLLARLTSDAVDELDLKVGAEVTALIKAVAVEGY